MSDRRHHLALWREICLALAVLALVFLNFGHANAGVQIGGDTAGIADSWCGDPLLPGGTDHPPCHACRFDGAALPPPPAGVEPVSFCVTPVLFDTASTPLIAPPVALRAQPRGPPTTL